MLLLFDPRLTEAWLRDLASDSRTVGISLCLEHANKVTVPAGWTLTDERATHNRVLGGAPGPTDTDTPASVRLASVTPIAADPEPIAPMTADETDPQEADTVSAGADDEADDESGDDDEESGDHNADVSEDDAAPDEPPDADGVIERPTLWADDEPEGLRVDPSTPLLSRAFRAAHID